MRPLFCLLPFFCYGILFPLQFPHNLWQVELPSKLRIVVGEIFLELESSTSDILLFFNCQIHKRAMFAGLISLSLLLVSSSSLYRAFGDCSCCNICNVTAICVRRGHCAAQIQIFLLGPKNNIKVRIRNDWTTFFLFYTDAT